MQHTKKEFINIRAKNNKKILKGDNNMKYKLIDLDTNNCYGVFATYKEAYEEKIKINHRIHLLCGGDYYIKLDIIALKLMDKGANYEKKIF